MLGENFTDVVFYRKNAQLNLRTVTVIEITTFKGKNVENVIYSLTNPPALQHQPGRPGKHTKGTVN